MTVWHYLWHWLLLPACFLCLGDLGGGYHLISAFVCLPHSEARSVVLSNTLFLWVLWGESCQSLSSFSHLKRSILLSNIPPIFLAIGPFFCMCFLPLPPHGHMFHSCRRAGLYLPNIQPTQLSISVLPPSWCFLDSKPFQHSIRHKHLFFNWRNSLKKNLTFSFDLINAHSFSPAASTTVSVAHSSLLNFSYFWAFILSSRMLKRNLHILCSSILPPSLIS